MTYDLNTIYEFLLHSSKRNDSFKEIIKLSYLIRNKIKKTNIMKRQILINYKEIGTKLEHFYLKYKNQFSLKDGKDLLVILIKLKNKQL